MSWYQRLSRQAEEEAWRIRRRAGGAINIVARGEPGRSLGVGHGAYRMSEESWTVSAAVDALLEIGWPPEALFVELTVERGSRPDLMAVGPRQVVVLEAKRGAPCSADRRQVRRYLDAARRRWPDREALGFLIWPRSRSIGWPYAESDLRIEDVA